MYRKAGRGPWAWGKTGVEQGQGPGVAVGKHLLARTAVPLQAWEAHGPGKQNTYRVPNSLRSWLSIMLFWKGLGLGPPILDHKATQAPGPCRCHHQHHTLLRPTTTRSHVTPLPLSCGAAMVAC